MKEKTEDFFSKYETKETIGKGTFSTVKLGINRKTKEKVAIKILEKKKILNKDDLERVEREIEILKNLNNINIVKINEIYQTKDKHYFIMEYCENGELFNHIVKKQRLNDKESSYFYYQLINGLEYIHSKKVVHRDLKPENLLLSKGNILKIVDFGLSNYFNGKKLLNTPCGSPCYASPEMVSGKKYNGFNIDIWSTGIILYAMICGYLPFEDKDNDVLFKKISKCKIDYPKFISGKVKSLLKKIIVSDPDKRIKIEDIKKEPFYLLGKNVFKDKHPELFVEDNVNFNINDNIIRNNVIYTISNSNVDNFNIDSDRNGNTNFNTLSTYKIKKNSLIEDNNNDIKNNLNSNENEFINIKNNINTIENEKNNIKNKNNTLENVNNNIINNININDYNSGNKNINYTIDSNRKESPNKKIIKSPDKKDNNNIHKIENEKDKKQPPFKFLNIEIKYKNHESIMKKVKNSPSKSTKASSNDTLRNNNIKNIYKKNNDKMLLINTKINNNTINNLENNNNTNKKQLNTSPHISTQKKIIELKKNIEELNQKNNLLRNNKNNKNNINKEKEIQKKRPNTVNSTNIKKHNDNKNNNNQILKHQKIQISTEEEILNKDYETLKRFSMSQNDSQQKKKNNIININDNQNKNNNNNFITNNNENNNKNDKNIKNINNDNNNIYYQTTKEKNAKSFSNSSSIDNKKIYYTNYTKNYQPNYDYSHLIYKSSNNNQPISFNNSHFIQKSNDIGKYMKNSNKNYDLYKLNFNSQSNFSLSSTNNSIENYHKNVNRFNTSARLNNLTSNIKTSDSYKSNLSPTNNYVYLTTVNSPRYSSSSNKHYSTTINKYLNSNQNNSNIKSVEGIKINNYDYINNKNIIKGINITSNYSYRNNYIKSSPIYLSTDYNSNKNDYNSDFLNKNKNNLSSSLNYLENNRHSYTNTYRDKIYYQKY